MSNLAAALQYATRLGWRVFPVHSVKDGRCSCGNERCASPGKHPRTKAGLNDATADEQTIREWWRRWPDAGIGIRTGEQTDGSRLVVVDVDDVGAFGALTQRNAPLPHSPRARTGGGGVHLYYSCERPLASSVGKIAPGVDVRGDGGYVVAAPSSHASGRAYLWEDSPEHVAVAPLPEWIEALARGGSGAARGPRAGAAGGAIQEGTRNRALHLVACAMRRQGSSEAVIRAALLAENEDRVVPPLDPEEVAKIAASAARYDPARVPPEREIYAQYSAHPTHDADGVAIDNDWADGLERGSEGQIRATIGNASLILSCHQDWRGVLEHDAFKHDDVFVRPPPFHADVAGKEKDVPRALCDADVPRVQVWLERSYGGRWGGVVGPGIVLAAKQREVHPARELVASLEWDGVPRLDTWCVDVLGARDCKATRLAGRWFLISLVARLFNPGAKVDSMAVFEGPQGIGKSKMLAALALREEWFSDDLPDLHDKDAKLALAGRLIIEVAELSTINRSSPELVKGYISRRVDKYREPYGRRFVDVPRQCVFAGTTNDNEYLLDSTGGRRFLPISCTAIDHERLVQVVPLLWAEARLAFLAGEKWYATTDLERALLGWEQEGRRLSDPWEAAISAQLAHPSAATAGVTVADLLSAIGIELARRNQRDSNRVAKILAGFGWARRQARVGSRREWRYYPDRTMRRDQEEQEAAE